MEVQHRIRDDDPMLASLELLEIFFQNAKIQIPDSSTATMFEVRAAIQQLDRLAKDFSKQTRELIVELRGSPSSKGVSSRSIAVWLAAVTCLVTGFLAGKFLF